MPCSFSEKFEQVTILFSDIVTFTNIAAAVQPIDIVNMLNALYSKFDDLTNIHGVYKVSVIARSVLLELLTPPLAWAILPFVWLEENGKISFACNY